MVPRVNSRESEKFVRKLGDVTDKKKQRNDRLFSVF